MKPYPKISQLRREFRVSACVCRCMDSNLPGISTEARYTIKVCQKNNLSTTLACHDGYAGPGRVGTPSKLRFCSQTFFMKLRQFVF